MDNQADNIRVRGESLRWRVENMDFSQVDLTVARADEDLMLLLCGASFVESGSDMYSHNLVEFFAGNDELGAWLRDNWEEEELQHGRALKAYIAQVWPDFDWDGAFARFLVDYEKVCGIEYLEEKPALEMVARCVVETGTATLYRAVREHAKDPVLRELCNNIRADEVQHYKQFLRYFKAYNVEAGHGRMDVMRALMRRLGEFRSEDSSIALRHVLEERYPDRINDAAFVSACSGRVNQIVTRNFPADMCIKMLLKPLDLPGVLQRGLYPPLAHGLKFASRYIVAR